MITNKAPDPIPYRICPVYIVEQPRLNAPESVSNSVRLSIAPRSSKYEPLIARAISTTSAVTHTTSVRASMSLKKFFVLPRHKSP